MWKSILVVKLENFWKFTPEIQGRYFRLRHIDPPKAPMGWVGQAEPITNTNYHQFYQIQRINGLSVYETFEYIKPPIFATRKLGFRQQTLVPNNWLIEIEVSLMPSYSLDDAIPVNSSASSSKNTTSVPVLATVTKVLAANPNRKGVKFYSADKLRTIYFDTDNVVNNASAIESITPSKPVCVPTINWTGEWYGISSGGTVTVEVEEYV